MLLGAHMSVEGGVENAIDRGESIGCTAIQIFAKNNRRMFAPPLPKENILDFKKKRRSSKIQVVFSHAGYLINLASPKKSNWDASIRSMRDELERAEALELPFVVLHPGASVDSSKEKGIQKIVAALTQLIRQTKGYKVKIALENTAGAGTGIGSRFEELAEIMDQVSDPRRIGVCLDTCHTLASGYDIRTKPAFDTTVGEFDKIVGLQNLLAIHMNDGKGPLGSRKDRHEHIGKGFLGLMPFRLLMNDKRFAKIPKVLETPKDPDMVDDMVNLNTLRNLVW